MACNSSLYALLPISNVCQSICIYNGVSFSLKKDYINRIEEANQGIFVFQLSPALSSLSKMDFASHTSLLCDSEYEVTSVKYSQGILELLVDYSKSMEVVAC
jgi:hypothetical protein